MASGIADYSFELLPKIAEVATVDAVSPRAKWPRRLRVPSGISRLDPRDVAEEAHDAVFYHLGNNPYHEFVYEAALARPGISVFHDVVMHHLIEHRAESGRRWPEYRTLLEREYGETGRRLGRLRMDWIHTDFEKFVFPLTAHVARVARAIVVHSQDSADVMRQLAPDLPVWVIPHHADASPVTMSREAARARLGLPQHAFLVGHFGFVTRPKQPAAVIGGFERLAKVRPDARLLITGADHTGGGLDKLVRTYGLSGKVIKAGYVDLERFSVYLSAVDATVNLRYPSAGESSGTFARALAAGRAAIVNDLGSFAEVPDAVALKVEVDGDQAAQVGAHLIRLAQDPEFRSTQERAASEYARTVLNPMRCRDLYLQVADADLTGRRPDRAPAPSSAR
jgi:glycosyltransferase involved in cell wall biosynthesis